MRPLRLGEEKKKERKGQKYNVRICYAGRPKSNEFFQSYDHICTATLFNESQCRNYVRLSVRHTLLLCYKSLAVEEMGDRLATIDKGRNVGTAVPLSVWGRWVLV